MALPSSCKISIGSALLVLMCLLAPGKGAAQGSQPEDYSSRYARRVGGLFFIPSGRISDPFVTTHVRTATGGGVANDFQAPFIDTDGTTKGTLQGDMGFVALDFEYQQNLFHITAFRLLLQGTARAGTSDESLLAAGLTAVYGLQAEGKIQIIRRSKWLVTGVVNYSGNNLYGISPLDFAKGVIDGGLSKDNDLVQESNTARLTAGFGAAYAPIHWLGFTLIANYGIVEPFGISKFDRDVFRLEATGNFDLGQLSSVPLGLLLTFQHDSYPGGGTDIVDDLQSFGFALAYTGRDDFSISIESFNGTLKLKDAERNSVAKQLLLNIRYYF